MKSKIVKELKHISIIYTFNDVGNFVGGSRCGIKESIDYFEQFLISYESIKQNWLGNNFTYDIHLVHSKPFAEKKLSILSNLDVTLHHIKNSFEPNILRHHAFLIDLDCDFRLVLDNDVIAVNEPMLNFDMDIQCQLGGSKWNHIQWKEICSWLNIKCPSQIPIITEFGNFEKYSLKEYFKYFKTKKYNDLFPSFNGGVIFVKNTISKQYGHTLVSCAMKYFKNRKFKIRFLGIQDILGVVANEITPNWGVLPIGMNYILTNWFSDTIKNDVSYPMNNIYLLHYINLDKAHPKAKMINNIQKLVNKKYLK